jgi:hypothetical protein
MAELLNVVASCCVCYPLFFIKMAGLDAFYLRSLSLIITLKPKFYPFDHYFCRSRSMFRLSCLLGVYRSGVSFVR